MNRSEEGDGVAGAKILVVDDASANVEVLRRLLTRRGYGVCIARDGREALDVLAREAPDLVLLDVMMPKLDGFEVCRRIKQEPLTRLLPVILLTGLEDADSRLQGIEAGADDFITKPFNAQELQARVRSLIRLKRYTDDLDSAESVIMSLAMTIEARDAYTNGHCSRLAAYARALGQRLGLSEDQLAALSRGGYLHDIGKIAVGDAVLLKPGPLTDEEYQVVKRHTTVGDRLCGELRSLKDVRPIVRHHHERQDGSGYPDGLAGEDIPLLAQIMAIVDVFDALTTARPYKPAFSLERAKQELIDQTRRGWRRRDLVDEFLTAVEGGGIAEPAPPPSPS